MFRELILFFFFFITQLLFLNPILAEIIRGSKAEAAFSNYYVNRSIKNLPDELCNIEKNRKIAICSAVIGDVSFKNYFGIYLNKFGISRNRHMHNCEEHSVKLHIVLEDTKPIEVPHQMFPCYGRHDPVRSRWNIDDYYNVVFLSGGPTRNSVFIFIRNLLPRSEEYHIYGLMTDILIDNLPEVTFLEEELNYELESLNRWSHNSNVMEIEVLFIRNVLFNSAIIPDTICHFNIEQKMELCEKILSRNLYRNFYWELDQAAFRSFGSKCVPNKLEFVHFYEYNEKVTILQLMIPCYGIIEGQNLDQANNRLTTLYLSAGFRDNSVLVFFKYSESSFTMREFIENVKLNDISGDNYYIDDRHRGPSGSPSTFDFGSFGRVILDSNVSKGDNTQNKQINGYDVDINGMADLKRDDGKQKRDISDISQL